MCPPLSSVNMESISEFLGVQLIINVVIVPDRQQKDSSIHIHVQENCGFFFFLTLIVLRKTPNLLGSEMEVVQFSIRCPEGFQKRRKSLYFYFIMSLCQCRKKTRNFCHQHLPPTHRHAHSSLTLLPCSVLGLILVRIFLAVEEG